MEGEIKDRVRDIEGDVRRRYTTFSLFRLIHCGHQAMDTHTSSLAFDMSVIRV